MFVGASEGASDSREVVQASEILETIENDKTVEYDNAIVEWDLDLNGLDLPTEHVDRTEGEINWFCLTEEAKVVRSPIDTKNNI